ncbi:MAG: hypothetical protein LLF97_10175 [Planctomycetaceae bacterium]|nr:hypothetical protein [Planctomycetaceae bacterium]
MAEQPPIELVAMLERLGVAKASDLQRLGARVRRLARDLPRFESVWIDALLQARRLTPFQAAELNAGRGAALRVGPYRLERRMTHPCYVATYQARHVDSGELVRLAVIDAVGLKTEETLAPLEKLLAGSPHPNPLPRGEGTEVGPLSKETGTGVFPSLLSDVGVDGERLFLAAPWVEGRTAAEWIVHRGRFPPDVVLEIVRSMAAQLAAWSAAGVCHGDVSVSSLVLTDDGHATLVLPGVRPILRPEEGYAHADLLPEAFDSFAPERVAKGLPAGESSDIYACGCVGWQLLCGRPPLAGGDSLAKLRAAQAGGIGDVRRFAVDVPGPLAAAIATCVQREPGRRPESFARLAAMLGPPTCDGRQRLAHWLAQSGRPTVAWTTTIRSVRRSKRTPLWVAGSICTLATVVALLGSSIGTTVQKGPSTSGKALTLALSERERGPKSPAPAPKMVRADVEHSDSEVTPVVYQTPVDRKPPDLVLAGDRPVEAGSLNVRAGQCVRAAPGGRATVLVPGDGWTIDQENVRFENLDFRRQPSAERGGAPATLVRLTAGQSEFRGCWFQGSLEPVVAVRWQHPARPDRSGVSLPCGRIRLLDCRMDRVAVGVDCSTIGALGFELKNVLHCGGGPMVRLDHCPGADEPVSLTCEQITLRGGGPLLECRVPRPESSPGEIAVQATACVFMPAGGEPLVRLVGVEGTERLARSLRWGGQGSLVSPHTAIVACQAADGSQNSLDESSLSIAGLVRGDVQFAGSSDRGASANRVTGWQAPLPSDDPPGAAVEALPRTGE